MASAQTHEKADDRPYNPWSDHAGAGLFGVFIERKPRCRAVVLTRQNVWTVTQWLVGRGHGARAGWSDDGQLILEVVLRCENPEPFTANIDEGDALILGDPWSNSTVSHVPGHEFRQAWEKEAP